MLFRKNTTNDTLKFISQENRRLKQENQRLRESLEDLQKYKGEYSRLIAVIRQMKEQYLNKMDEFEELQWAYKHELDKFQKTGGD